MTTPEVKVTQADEEAAEDLRERLCEGISEEDMALAFAKHRVVGIRIGLAEAAMIADEWLASDYDESANVACQNIRDDILARDPGSLTPMGERDGPA